MADASAESLRERLKAPPATEREYGYYLPLAEEAIDALEDERAKNQKLRAVAEVAKKLRGRIGLANCDFDNPCFQDCMDIFKKDLAAFEDALDELKEADDE